MNTKTKTIVEITDRAKKLKLVNDKSSLFLVMPLALVLTDSSLEQLLEFDDDNFTHDVVGIIKNQNGTTKSFDNEFVPRCWKEE